MTCANTCSAGPVEPAPRQSDCSESCRIQELHSRGVMSRQTTETHPKELHQKPPFDEPPQAAPGLDSEMHNAPDHGEQSYRGSGRLNGKTALITVGDSGIGRPVAIAFAREGPDVALSYLPEEEQDAGESMRWIAEAGPPRERSSRSPRLCRHMACLRRIAHKSARV